MAGIGFRLQRLVAGGTYSKSSAGYFSAAIISAGPWVSAVLSLALLGVASAKLLSHGERQLLFTTITYAFIISLVLAGGLQLTVTRYLADRLYLGETEMIAPTCSGVLVAASLLLTVMLPFLLWGPLTLLYRLLAAALFLALSLSWLVMVFISATRDYSRVVGVFVAGSAVSLGAGVLLGQQHGLLGSLTGYTFGQVLALSLLIAYVYREFPSHQGISFAFLEYGRKYWNLMAIGFLYNLGIWADNVVYWWSPNGITVAGFFRVFPDYDSAKLMAYLLTIPAAALFLVHLESDFYRHYRTFYQSCVREKANLTRFLEAKRGMIEAARSGIASILKLQTLVATAGVLLAPELATFLGLPPGRIPLLRIEVLAASAQFLLLTSLLLLLYLDARREALIVVILFALCNAGLSEASLHLGAGFSGWGYLLATVSASLLAWAYLSRRLSHLEYVTFMSQPIVVESRAAHA